MGKKGFAVLIVGLVCLAVVPAYAQFGIFDKTADWGLDDTYQRGNFKIPGSVTVDGDKYTLEGNGNDIWDQNDEGFFVYTEKSGSWRLSARVNWIDPGSNDWSKIGVMFREKGDLSPSRHYWIELRGANFGDRVDAQWRSSEGSGSSNTQIFEDPPDNTVPVEATADGVWLRVTRVASADVFISEWSLDGNEWNFAHSLVQPDWPDTVAVGLAITSHVDDENLVIAEVDNVKLEQAAPPVAIRSLSSETFSPGDSIDVSIEVINDGASAENVTITENIPAGWTASDVSNGGSASADTVTWSLSAAPGSTTISYKLTSPADASEAATLSGTVGVLNVSGSGSLILVFPAPEGDPIFTNHADITGGRLGAAGSAVYNKDTGEYVIEGSGHDIWDAADDFHFLFKEMSGNFSIQAKVFLDVGGGNGTWAKAGPMIRDNLSAGSAHAFAMIRNGGQDFAPQWRDSQGAGGAWDGDATIVGGQDGDFIQEGVVGLIREGSNITFTYVDVDTGELVKHFERDMAGIIDPVYVGLAVTSHQEGEISTGFFTDVEIVQLAKVSEWSLY